MAAPGVQIVHRLVMGGLRDPNKVVHVVRAYPHEHHQIFALLYRTMGVAFVHSVLRTFLQMQQEAA